MLRAYTERRVSRSTAQIVLRLPLALCTLGNSLLTLSLHIVPVLISSLYSRYLSFIEHKIMELTDALHVGIYVRRNTGELKGKDW